MPSSPLSKVLLHLRDIACADKEQLSDAQLLNRFLTARDEAAFETLVRRHGPMMREVCRRVLKNAHDAEDAFQATFLVLVRKAASIRKRETVGGFLQGVACKTALKAREVIEQRRARERQAGEMPRRSLDDDNGREIHALLDQELSSLPACAGKHLSSSFLYTLGSGYITLGDPMSSSPSCIPGDLRCARSLPC